MIVVVLSVCPPKLRGQLTRWLLEITAGVYVGHVPAKVRDLLWLRIVEDIGRGRALMVHSSRGEQRLAFRVHNHDWEPVEYDGLHLMMRPARGTGQVATRRAKGPGGRSADHDGDEGEFVVPRPGRPANWSIAARRRKFRNEIEKRRDTE